MKDKHEEGASLPAQQHSQGSGCETTGHKLRQSGIFHPWRCSETNWTQLWETWSNCEVSAPWSRWLSEFPSSLNYSVILLERGTLLLSRKIVVDEPGMRRQEPDCFWRGERQERRKILEPLPFHGVHKSRSARTNIACSVYLSMFWPSSRVSSLTYRALVEMCNAFNSSCHIVTY